MIGRTIPHAHLLVTRELYETSGYQEVLQDVAMAEMQGLLRQIALLGASASDIFQGILTMSTDISARIAKTKENYIIQAGKVDGVENLIRSAPNKSKLYTNIEDRLLHSTRMKENLFTKDTRDRTLNLKYESCGKTPDFSELDCLRTAESKLQEGQSCKREYSNPDYFMEQWQIAEARRLEVEKAEAAEAKIRRKQKRIKKKTTRAVRGTQPIAVIAKKKYNPLGAEFGTPETIAEIGEPVQKVSLQGVVSNNKSYVRSSSVTRASSLAISEGIYDADEGMDESKSEEVPSVASYLVEPLMEIPIRMDDDDEGW